MSSPTSGGQHHWAYELAPKTNRKFLSWITGRRDCNIPKLEANLQGWFTVLGWHSLSSSALYLVSTMVQGLLVLNDPGYIPVGWHTALGGYCVLIVCLVFNYFGAGKLPQLEGFILVAHVTGFFAIFIPMVHLAPRSTAKFVFKDIESYSGWDSKAVSWCIGILGNLFPFVGKRTASRLCSS
jgi:choline transport protein